jgi:acetyltransferase-like isoleucine patch superfamily enzyme
LTSRLVREAENKSLALEPRLIIIIMARFKNWQYPKIEEGKPTKYNWIVQNLSGFKMAKNTDIGAFTYINAQEKVIIEEGVQIGSHCSIYSVSTIDNKKGQVYIKANASIGSHSVVMPGVIIGENSVCGAFSFVNKDVPDNSLALGIPIKIKRKNKIGKKK